jgi:hypothetical protein
VPTAPLFEQDLEAFVRRVRDADDVYVTPDRVLAVLKLADQIRERCGAATATAV